jgi:hypothetical protein
MSVAGHSFAQAIPQRVPYTSFIPALNRRRKRALYQPAGGDSEVASTGMDAATVSESVFDVFVFEAEFSGAESVGAGSERSGSVQQASRSCARRFAVVRCNDTRAVLQLCNLAHR